MQESILKILNNYLKFTKTSISSENDVYKAITKELPEKINALLNDNNLDVKGSMGRGKVATIPWVAIMDKRITRTTPKGFYIVILFKEDMSGFYLTLNQGITYFKEQFAGKTFIQKAKRVSKYFQDQINSSIFSRTDINLGMSESAKGYAATTILSKYYPKENVPNNEVLKQDIICLCEKYKNMVEKIKDIKYEQFVDKILKNSEISLNTMGNKFSWVPFFKEFADKVLEYKNNRGDLIKHLSNVFVNLNLKNPLDPKNKKSVILDIDPFTVFACINRAPFKFKDKLDVLAKIKQEFNITAPAPTDLEGVPTRNSIRVWFSGGEVMTNASGNKNIDDLWELFESGLKLADGKEADLNEFNLLFVKCYNHTNVKWGAAYGLFWCRPEYFVGLDRKTRDYLKDNKYLTAIEERNIGNTPGAYIQLCENIKNDLFTMNPPFETLYQLSAHIWDKKLSQNQTNKLQESEIMKNLEKNLILFGPPGTGKTYNTKTYAVAVCCDDLSLNDTFELDYETEIVSRFNELVEDGRVVATTFHQSYGYEEFIEGITALTINNNIQYFIQDGVFKKFCDEARGKDENYIFIIDEINRGNISKVFGELITLLEESKREGCVEGSSVILPYSKTSFSIPQNVFVLGTMNTADRSITLMDTALRRRFQFIEMRPDSNVLRTIDASQVIENASELDVAEMLEVINQRIEVLFDREHTIGHAYFAKLKDFKPENRMPVLASIFKDKIVPLLQEYFYEDYTKIRLVLGDNGKRDTNYQFIKEIKNQSDIFRGSVSMDDVPEFRYEINEEAFEHIESYIQII